MSFFLILKQLLRDLGSQRLRTFLTVFGIVWGTAAVSLLLAFRDGLHPQMVKNSTGLGPIYGEMRNMIPQAEGRFLDPIDQDRERRVAFLGNKLAVDLFDKADPVGQSVLLAGSPFLIVGVLKEKSQDSNYSGPDEGK